MSAFGAKADMTRAFAKCISAYDPKRIQITLLTIAHGWRPRVQGAGLKALVCIPGELGGRTSPRTNGRSQSRSGQPCRFRAPADLSAVQPYVRSSITRTETVPKKCPRHWDNLCGGHRTQPLKPTEEPIPLLAHSRHSDDTDVCPREQIGHDADGVECSFL